MVYLTLYIVQLLVTVVAIMSDSTPRMHRRGGSGDMSYLHSHKQPDINKLTRSYDMSLRSLMSEELSVKVQTPSSPVSRDQVGNELLAEPMPPGHNLLLSPKYGGGKDAAAVKLLTRPTGQTIKKQTTPNKDSGPPQPVKAIHTLPPSQPVSRENTFDSLPQRSPLGSDSDPRDAVADSPDSKSEAGSTSTRSQSYHRRTPSPQRSLKGPQRREPSPHRRSHKEELRRSLVDLDTDKVNASLQLVTSAKVTPSEHKEPTAPVSGTSPRRRQSSTSDEDGLPSPSHGELLMVHILFYCIQGCSG